MKLDFLRHYFRPGRLFSLEDDVHEIISKVKRVFFSPQAIHLSDIKTPEQVTELLIKVHKIVAPNVSHARRTAEVICFSGTPTLNDAVKRLERRHQDRSLPPLAGDVAGDLVVLHRLMKRLSFWQWQQILFNYYAPDHNKAETLISELKATEENPQPLGDWLQKQLSRQQLASIQSLDIHAKILDVYTPEEFQALRQAFSRIGFMPHRGIDIEASHQQFCQGFLERMQSDDFIATAAWLHETITSIHYFDDGMGRTARMLMNIYLGQNGFETGVYFSDNDSYTMALRGCAFDKNAFKDYLSSQIQAQSISRLTEGLLLLAANAKKAYTQGSQLLKENKLAQAEQQFKLALSLFEKILDGDTKYFSKKYYQAHLKNLALSVYGLGMVALKQENTAIALNYIKSTEDMLSMISSKTDPLVQKISAKRQSLEAVNNQPLAEEAPSC